MRTTDAIKIAVAYIRVSTEDQTELSPDPRLHVILDVARADGWTTPKEYTFMEKRGISGRKADNRPEFQQMISLAKSRSPAPFARLYLWKFSRFARNQEESMFYKGILRKKCGIDIISVSEPIAEGMLGQLIEAIVEWFDEYCSVDLSGEVLRSMNDKTSHKGYQSTPCPGYDVAGKGRPHVINEKEYAIAAFIHNYYHAGHDINAVAWECNRRGYRARCGNLFKRRTVERILRNRFHIGIVEWNGIVFYGPYEARLVITDVFEENQDRLDREYRPGDQRGVSSCRHWLSGLLVCGTCGVSLSVNRSKSRQGRSVYFQCWEHTKGYHTGSCCLSVEQAEAAVLDSLKAVLAAGTIFYEYETKGTETPADERTVLKAALSRLDKRGQRIRDAYENSIDSLEEYKANKERLKAEHERLTAELASLIHGEAKNAPVASQEAGTMVDIHTALELIANPAVSYEREDAALRRVLKKIVYHRQENGSEFRHYV